MDVNQRFGDQCPNILALVDVVLALPASSAICERGFSVMKRLKSNIRSSLLHDSLVDQLRIIIHSPSVEDFDPTPAIHLWAGASERARRPDQAPYGPRVRACLDSSESDLESDSGSESQSEPESPMIVSDSARLSD